MRVSGRRESQPGLEAELQALVVVATAGNDGRETGHETRPSKKHEDSEF